MSFDLEQVYSLLPAIYRIRDLEQGEPLKALLTVITEQIAVLEEDLSQLYDDQFIETCAEWVVPYIGDLISYRTPYGVFPQSLRPEVAHTIGFRRRKGTAALLEQLARDVTGWNAHVVEFFQLLATTQYMNHPRPASSLPDLRLWKPLAYLDSAFDSLSHTPDVRNIASMRGRYNIPNIGIFLWRLGSYSLTAAPAFKLDEYRYLFSPLGNNTQLFTQPTIEADVTHLTGPLGVAMPISRTVLAHTLDQYYGPGKSLFLNVNGKDVLPDPKKPSQTLADLIDVQDLSDLRDAAGNVTGWKNMPRHKIVIDPELGRIAFPRRRGRRPPTSVQGTFHYAFSADMGGGEYRRSDTFTQGLLPIEQVPSPHASIQEALNALPAAGGVVEITDSGRNGELVTITAAANAQIELRAADFRRPLLVLEQETGIPEMLISGEEGSQVSINGLVISGGILRVTGKLSHLVLKHCTLVPGLSLSQDNTPQHSHRPSLIIESTGTLVEIDRCILGGLRVTQQAQVHITNSIVDATRRDFIAYAAPVEPTDDVIASTLGSEASPPMPIDRPSEQPVPGGPLHIENSTIIGVVHTASIDLASNTIFLAHPTEQEGPPLYAERRQSGCIRYSYLPAGARTPRRYHCQPANERDAERIEPQFTSLRYGHPGYCQLSLTTTQDIRQGADDQAEMGAFHTLYQPQRETNLRMRLDEYLRLGIEAGIFYMT